MVKILDIKSWKANKNAAFISLNKDMSEVRRLDDNKIFKELNFYATLEKSNAIKNFCDDMINVEVRTYIGDATVGINRKVHINEL